MSIVAYKSTKVICIKQQVIFFMFFSPGSLVRKYSSHLIINEPFIARMFANSCA